MSGSSSTMRMAGETSFSRECARGHGHCNQQTSEIVQPFYFLIKQLSYDNKTPDPNPAAHDLIFIPRSLPELSIITSSEPDAIFSDRY